MLERLSEGEATVSELAAPFDMSLPAVSKHLSVLERAGLVERSREGRVRRCRLRPEGLRPATEWVRRHERYWSEALQSLSDYLQRENEANE